VNPEVSADVDELKEIDKYQRLRSGNRKFALFNNILEIVPNLLNPSTIGFDHINMDMTFSDLNAYDKFRVERMSDCISITSIIGIDRSNYLFRNKLATILNSNKSKGGRSMKLLTDTSVNNTFRDTTKESGFSMPFKRKRSGGYEDGGV